MSDTFCERQSTDSNVTGLRIAEELCPGQLPTNPVWFPMEPNSYSDFGGQYTSVARNPINPSRQRKKGVITDLDASGGFNQDVTQTNLARILQGFFFADARERGNTRALKHDKASPVTVTASGDKSYTIEQSFAVSANVTAAGTGYEPGELLTVAGGTASRPATFVVSESEAGVVSDVILVDPGSYSVLPANAAATTSAGDGTGVTLTIVWDELLNIVAGDLVLAKDFAVVANNGVKTAVSFAASKLIISEAVVTEAAPVAASALEVIGHEFAAGVVAITMNGNLVRLSSTTVDMAVLGCIPGEWLFVGDDLAANQFALNAPGFARVSSVKALSGGTSWLEFDKVTWDAVADAAAGKLIRIFYGAIIKNESDPTLIKRRSYQLERTLGEDANGTRSELIIGGVPSELTLNVPTADKVTVDLTFVGISHEPRNGASGLKAGDRPSIVESDAFNTSQNFPVVHLATVDPLDAKVNPLFAFASEMTLTINNNVNVLKAVGKLGGFDISAGTFEVGGSQTTYFSGVEATQAVRDNLDVTQHFVMVQSNAGSLWDIALMSLGDGRNQVEQDQPITVNLDQSAAESKFGHTLLFQAFAYLPDAAV